MNENPGGGFASRALELAIPALAGALLGLGLPGCTPSETGTTEEHSFTLREVSVFERNESQFLRGQSALCSDKPDSEVKGYPRLASGKPIYGSVRFPIKPNDPASGAAWHFAIDESQGTGNGYDRFYFDLNHDGDLRNDAALAPQARPPESGRLSYDNVRQQVLFDFLKVPLAFDATTTRPVELLPRLMISVYDKEEYKQVTFVRTRLREGDIRIGKKEFRALLGNDYVILGRLDSPATALLLTSKDEPNNPAFRWWGGDRLKAAHNIEGRFFTFAASPTGDRLMVRPYQGEIGVFEIGAGGRALDQLTVSGSLEAEDLAVPVGGEIVGGFSSGTPAQQCRIPVGDYMPHYLTVQFGHLRISLSPNYHSDGKPRDRAERPPVYGMKVAKDRPYVLDFSGPPDVMFASPAKDQRIKVGEALEVKAVLVDPRLDIMIRGLDDTTRKTNQAADGQSLGYERFVSLDPKVVIRRTDGTQVAEGVMPFG